MKDDGWMLKDEGWMLKDEWIMLMGGLRTDEQTDIYDCRVAFTSEKQSHVRISIFVTHWLFSHDSDFDSKFHL